MTTNRRTPGLDAAAALGVGRGQVARGRRRDLRRTRTEPVPRPETGDFSRPSGGVLPDQVWFRIAEEAIGRMPEKTPRDRGARLVDALIVWAAVVKMDSLAPRRELEDEPDGGALLGRGNRRARGRVAVPLTGSSCSAASSPTRSPSKAGRPRPLDETRVVPLLRPQNGGERSRWGKKDKGPCIHSKPSDAEPPSEISAPQQACHRRLGTATPEWVVSQARFIGNAVHVWPFKPRWSRP